MGIGYGRQHYFVYSHHDTGNNHVHIVTTRIQPNGKAIPDHQDDSDRYRKLDPDDRTGFLMQLAIDHLTNKNAQDIVDRISKQAT